MGISGFILAAGKGKRLHPFTLHTPKPMLSLLDKPIIHHSVSRLLQANIKRIGIVISQNDTLITQYIQKTFPELDTVFIVQKKVLGTAHAVMQLEDYTEKENFLVIAGDSLFHASYLQQLGVLHNEERNAITLSLVKMDFDQMKSSSTVDYHDRQVWEIREKPTTLDDILSDLNSAALYVFSNSIFDLLYKIKKSIRGEYELATVINKTIENGQRVGGLITDKVYHFSNSHDLWRFNMEFLENSSKRRSNGNLVDPSAKISKSSKIKNSIIGENVVINNNVRIENTVILPSTIVEKDYINALVQPGYYETFSSKYSK